VGWALAPTEVWSIRDVGRIRVAWATPKVTQPTSSSSSTERAASSSVSRNAAFHVSANIQNTASAPADSERRDVASGDTGVLAPTAYAFPRFQGFDDVDGPLDPQQQPHNTPPHCRSESPVEFRRFYQSNHNF
jgi:hypothetical protein